MLLFEAFLNDDHSSNFKTKSSSTSLNSLLEETHTFDNSLPEFTTFSKVLFDAECESDSSDDHESFSPSPILVKDSDSLMEEIDLFCTPDYPLPPGIVDEDYDPERDILIHGDTGILNIKMMGEVSDQKDFMQKLMITLDSHQEKSPDLLSHRCGTVMKFNTHRSHLNICPMLIHGQNTPPLDVL
nr:hypothetical protein [Tanacetum cinerariifolium]